MDERFNEVDGCMAVWMDLSRWIKYFMEILASRCFLLSASFFKSQLVWLCYINVGHTKIKYKT